MTERPFQHHRDAALALLNAAPTLARSAAGFCGHVCVAAVLSERQRNWLDRLLSQHRLPPLVTGGDQ